MATAQALHGPVIQLADGSYFDLDMPVATPLRIEVIAHSLANQCRYTGHCNRFYSVAQHSVLVSQIVPPELALTGLLHDAAEAVLGDVARPLKQMLPEFKELEDRIEGIIFHQWGIPQPLPQEVKDADMVMLATERRDLMEEQQTEWGPTVGYEPLAETIMPWSPGEARWRFWDRYCEIVEEEHEHA